MPTLHLNARPANIKIIKRSVRSTGYDVYSLRTGHAKHFASVNAMISYHSRCTTYIDYDTSIIIMPIGANQIIDTNEKVVVRVYNMTSGAHTNKLLNGTTVPQSIIDAEDSTTIYRKTSMYPVLDRVLTMISGVSMINSTTSASPFTRSGTVERVVEANNTFTYDNVTYTNNTNLVYGYHTQMTLEKLRTEGDRTVDNRRYFGIELEIDTVSDNYNQNTKTRMATILNGILNNNIYNSFCKMERDGSLSQNGIEVITQPMTYNYIYEHKEQLQNALRAMSNNGYTSHDNGRCGLHIHVSRTEISPDTLDKVVLLFENFKNELIVFSRRTQQGMRWAKFITDDSSRTTIDGEFVKIYKDSNNMKSHGVVINNQNEHTVEFRLFRGTTSYGTLMASLQLVDNIITMAQTLDVNGITWSQIINFNPEHVELIGYNTKRQIISTHSASTTITTSEVCNRGVLLVRPFQLNITTEGDRE